MLQIINYHVKGRLKAQKPPSCNSAKDINLGDALNSARKQGVADSSQLSSEDEIGKSWRKGKVLINLILREFRQIMLCTNIQQYFFYGLHLDVFKVLNKFLIHYQNNQIEGKVKISMIKFTSIFMKIINEEFLNEKSNQLNDEYYKIILKKAINVKRQLEQEAQN